MPEFWNAYKYSVKPPLTSGIKDESNQTCLNRIKGDFAIVEVVFSSPFALEFKQDIRLSMTDKISNIGKLI